MCTRPTTSQAHIIVRAGEELVSIFAFASAIMVSDIRETVHALSTFSAHIKSIFADDSGCVWIQEPFGISVRDPFDRSSALLRPPSGRGVTEETTNMFNRIIERPRPRPKLGSRRHHRGFDARRPVVGRSPANARPTR